MDESAARDRLRGVEDPDLGEDLVSLGLVDRVAVDEEAEVLRIVLRLGAPYAPAERAIGDRIRAAFEDTGYDIELATRFDTGRGPEDVLPEVTNVVAVASGKGGVGKSTVAVNVAVGLADAGARVGLFDADIYGPNVPRMVGATEPPTPTEDETFIPAEAHGVKLMSIDFLSGPDTPVIWRGPMVHKMVTRFVEDVEWGDLDYLVIDLPPGTGDTQLTLLQTVPLTGAVVVTTPQTVALEDARKGLKMFGDHEETVLGVVENMSAFVCPDCGSEHAVFGTGGGSALADEQRVPFLGSVPLDPSIRTGGDAGEPPVLGESRAGIALREVAMSVADNVGIVNRRSVQRG